MITEAENCLVIAHRGASGIVGEDNTMAAFECAVDLGCDAIELDLRQTADQEIVCFHDADLDGTPLTNLTYPELCAAAGYDIVRLQDVLAFCADRIRLVIEVKESGFEARLADALRHRFPRQDAVVISFSHDVLRQLAAEDCPVPLGLLLPELEDFTNREAAVAILPLVQFIAAHESWFVDGHLNAAPWSTLATLLWTVDCPNRMRAMSASPIKGIISNRPDLLQAVLSAPRRHVNIAEIAHLPRGRRLRTLLRSETPSAQIPSVQVLSCDLLADEMSQWAAAISDGPTLYVGDVHTFAAAPELPADAKRIVLVPNDGQHKISPHLDHAERLTTEASQARGLVAIGSGTINDICKYAATQLGIPYMAVATAPSMNGYTSAIAALVVDGLKSTLPCRPPVAVLTSPKLLASAPPAMLKAGYADLLSKLVATADWRLASIVAGGDFDTMPHAIVHGALMDCIANARDIADANPVAVHGLFESLILSGFAMAVAGSSAPASGGEHLLSHYWDMQAYQQGKLPALHGLQVGLGTLVSAKLYDLVAQVNPRNIPTIQRTEEELKRAHGPLWASIEDQAQRQLLSKADAIKKRNHIVDEWPRIWQELAPYTSAMAHIREHLEAADVPTTAAALGVTRGQVETAVLHAADIRDRYTILHFARDVGVLPKAVPTVLGEIM